MSAVNSISSPDWQNRVYLLGSSALTDCSARGQVENGVCVCDGGWTGLSDFVNAVNVQCQVSIWSVRGLWVANLAAFVVVAVIVFPRILDLSQRAWNTRVRMLRKGKSYSVWSNSGLVSISFFFLVCFPSQMIVGMLRLFTEDRRIGMDYLITFFWFMERFGYYCAAGIHQPNLLRHLLKAQDASHTEVERFARLSQMLFGLAVLSGFWALPVLVTGGDNIPLARVCFAGYCFMQVTTFGLLAVQAHYLGIELHAVLTRSYLISRNEQTSQLRDMIMLGQKAARNLAAMQAIMYLAFFVAPPLWITHDYLLPISWFGPIAMSKRVVDSIYKHAKKSTDDTSKQKSGNTGKQLEPFGMPPRALTDLSGVPRVSEGGLVISVDSGLGKASGDLARNAGNALVDSDGAAQISMTFDSRDESVMVVDEKNPALLARGYQWINFRAAAGGASSEESAAPSTSPKAAQVAAVRASSRTGHSVSPVGSGEGISEAKAG